MVPFQIVDGNAKTGVSNRREPGMFCGESEQPQAFISETSYVKITFYAANYTDQVISIDLFLTNMVDQFCSEFVRLNDIFAFHFLVRFRFAACVPSSQTYFSFDSRSEQQMEVYLRYGQHPELYPNRRGEVVQGYVVYSSINKMFSISLLLGADDKLVRQTLLLLYLYR